MKPSPYALTALLLTLGLLGGCGEQKEQIRQEFDNKFRTEFVEAFSRQCIESIPQQARLTVEQKQTVCECAARNAVEVVSAAEIVQAVAGDIPPELHNKLSTAATPCLAALDADLDLPASAASQP